MTKVSLEAGVDTVASYPLQGRRALITGAGKRVGAAIAQRLGSAGMQVAVHYHRSKDGAEQCRHAVERAGGKAWLLQADLRTPQACRTLVERAVGTLGGLDALVVSAADFDAVALQKITPDIWAQTMALNLEAPLWLAQHAAPTLRTSGGAIVFVTCHSTLRPFKGYLPYVVSKAALKQLTHALALELAPEVRVNAVAPGAVLPPDNTVPSARARMAQRNLLGKLGRAEDVAEAVAYLLSAPFVTGQQLLVDGGQFLNATGDAL